MSSRYIFVWSAMAAAAALLSGCANRPPATLLVLPLPAAVQTAEAYRANDQPLVPASAGPVKMLTVRRFSIPEYLQTNAVRYRAQDSAVAEWPDAAWAERLSVGLSHGLALRLRQALPGWQVCDAACAGVPQGLVLSIDAAPLDYVRAQRVLQAEVRWRLSSPDPSRAGTGVGGGEHVMSVGSDDPHGQAQALGHLLDALAVEIAQGLK